MKRNILIILSLVLILGLGSLSIQAEDYHIGWVTYTLEVSYFQHSVAGAREAADEHGVKLTVLDPRASEEKQVEQIENLIAMNVDALVVDAIDAHVVRDVVGEAVDRGIKVIAVDTDIDHPGVLSTIAVPNKERSREFGRYIAGWIDAKYDGKAKIGVLLASSTIQLERRDGFEETLSSIPESEIVDTGDGRNIYERSQQEAEDMLTANPDIDVVYATGDPALMGSIAAAEVLGLAEDIDFFGWDQIPDHFVEPVKNGTIVGFINQMPATKGRIALEQAVKALRGEEVERYIDSPIEIVTKHNIDNYTK